jgi:hypothetical protein
MGIITGKGVMEYNDGSKYEGELLNGKREGTGELTLPVW